MSYIILINIISSINPTVHQVINQLRYRLSGPCPSHGSLVVPSIDLPTKRRHTICTPAVTVLEGLSIEISSEMGIPKSIYYIVYIVYYIVYSIVYYSINSYYYLYNYYVRTFGQLAVCQNLVALVNIKIAGKWMFIPLKMDLIGIDPYPIMK